MSGYATGMLRDRDEKIKELQARIDAALAACAAAETGYSPGVGVWISTAEIRAHLEPRS